MPIAALVVSTAIAVVCMIGASKKGKKKQDPSIGYRYWGDALEACACYSPRTAALWFNQLFRDSEEFSPLAHLPYAKFIGDTFDIGATPVDSAMGPAFTVPFDAAFTSWDQVTDGARYSAIPRFTRGGGQNPQVPSHLPGVAYIACNQAFMGLNTATLPTFSVIASMLPGVMYNLRRLGGAYDNEALWVRRRNTADIGVVLNVNPILIILDILLDRYSADDIDWEAAAAAGKQLIEQFPFMWFAVSTSPRRYKEFLEDISKKSKLCWRLNPDGKITFRVMDSVPPGGVTAFPIIDIAKHVAEISISRPSMSNAEIYNEIKGTYQAAQATDEYHPENTTPVEIHLRPTDCYSVDASNIVSTGVRNQEQYSLDFLTWGDDAQAYLEDHRMQREHPLIQGTITTTFAFNNLAVGDSFRLVFDDPASGLQLRIVVDVTEKTILGFPEEKIRFSVVESARWHGVMEGDPNLALDPTTPPFVTPPSQVIELVPVEFIAVSTSLMARGAPLVCFCAHRVQPAVVAIDYYLATSCALAEKSDDNYLAGDVSQAPMLGVLTEDFLLALDRPGSLEAAELMVSIPLVAGVSQQQTRVALDQLVEQFGGTPHLLFTEEGASANFLLLTTALAGGVNAHGAGVLLRYTTAVINESATEIFVTFQGLYLVDLQPADQAFAAGAFVVILPQRNTLTDYSLSAAPLPANVGRDTVMSSSAYYVKASPSSVSDELPWGDCLCERVALGNDWLDVPFVEIQASNTADSTGRNTGDVVYAGSDDVVAVLLNICDARSVVSNSDLFGVAQPRIGAGPELDISAADSHVYSSSSESSGISAYCSVTVTIRENGHTVFSKKLADNKFRFSFTPREVCKGAFTGKRLQILADVEYELKSSLLEQGAVLSSKTFIGPEIVAND